MYKRSLYYIFLTNSSTDTRNMSSVQVILKTRKENRLKARKQLNIRLKVIESILTNPNNKPQKIIRMKKMKEIATKRMKALNAKRKSDAICKVFQVDECDETRAEKEDDAFYEARFDPRKYWGDCFDVDRDKISMS